VISICLDHLRSMWLESDLPHAYVKQAVKSWLQASDDIFYAGLEALILWSDICLNLKV